MNSTNQETLLSSSVQNFADYGSGGATENQEPPNKVGVAMITTAIAVLFLLLVPHPIRVLIFLGLIFVAGMFYFQHRQQVSIMHQDEPVLNRALFEQRHSAPVMVM